jgi:NAD(P)-dependent dehydrogenase (short-subunit alcohol dehydrogenase family)
MGGIATDLEGRATLPGLYAVGECACTGLHGANRLASNSLSECFVFGRRAALAALSEPALSEPPEAGSALPRPELSPASREALWRCAGIERDENTVRDFDIVAAQRLVTMKLVGYTEVVHALLPRMSDDSSIVMFGGLARDRPYPGSTNVTTINGGVTALVRTLAVELAPMRVNAIHPAVVGDTPYWQAKPQAVLDALVERTPTGRLVQTADIVHGVSFLLENGSVNGTNLAIDGGWLLK